MGTMRRKICSQMLLRIILKANLVPRRRGKSSEASQDEEYRYLTSVNSGELLVCLSDTPYRLTKGNLFGVN